MSALDRFIAIYRRRGPNAADSSILFGLNLLGTAFESLGLGILLPVFQFIQAKGDVGALVAEQRFWQYIVDAFSALNVPLTVGTLLATSFVCILTRQILLYARLVFSGYLRARLQTGICNEGFENYLRATSGYRDREAAGDVVNALTMELRLAGDILLSPVAIANLATMAVIYAGILVLLSPSLSAAAIALFALSALTLRRLMKRSRQAGVDIADTNRSMSAFLVQRVKAARLVVLSGMESAEIANMRVLTNRLRERQVKINALVAALDVVIEPVVIAFGFVFLYLGTTQFDLRLEEIGLFIVIVLRLLPVVKDILKYVQALLAGLGSLEAVDRRLLAMQEAREPRSGHRVLPQVEKAIRFERVEFSYPGVDAIPALRGIDLVIPAQTVTALVGPSGAGKSTLIDMLPRLREPSAGRVYIDDVGLSEFDLKSLRQAISYMPQAPQIFDVTAAEHIRYGKPDASENDIREAARLAGAAEFIERLPTGYASRLGEDGRHLSGGQRQRLDLARALVRRAPILILDEPTSNLDAESEQRFAEALQRIKRELKITIIIIGHRLTTVTAADQIVVLRDGRIDDLGTHAELISRTGWYADALRASNERDPIIKMRAG